MDGGGDGTDGAVKAAFEPDSPRLNLWCAAGMQIGDSNADEKPASLHIRILPQSKHRNK